MSFLSGNLFLTSQHATDLYDLLIFFIHESSFPLAKADTFQLYVLPTSLFLPLPLLKCQLPNLNQCQTGPELQKV